MNIIEAINQTRQGKIIVNKQGYKIYLSPVIGTFHLYENKCKDNGPRYCFTYDDFMAKDWEVVE